MDFNDTAQLKDLAMRAVKHKLPLPTWTREGFVNAVEMGILEVTDRIDTTILQSSSEITMTAELHGAVHDITPDQAQGELLFYYTNLAKREAKDKFIPDNPLGIFYPTGFDAEGKPLTAGLTA